MKKTCNRSISALLALALLLLPLLAFAEEKQGEDALGGLDQLCLTWLAQIEAGMDKNSDLTLKAGPDAEGTTMLEALHFAADTLIRMGYETEETLANYAINTARPNFIYDNAWLVNLRLQKGAKEPVTYSVEVSAATKALVSIAFGDLYAYGGKEATNRTLSVRETIMDAPVYGRDARELAEALALKNEATLGGGMPQPLEGTAYVIPGDGDIARVDALEATIVATVSEGDYTLGDLYAYRAAFSIAEDAAGQRAWTVLLMPPEMLVAPYIRCRVNAGTGEVLALDIVETADRESRGVTDEEGYKALVGYWMAHEYSGFELYPPDGFNGAPTDDEVQLETALRTAIDMILNLSDLSMDALYAYIANVNFYDKGSSAEGFGYEQRGWTFYFNNWTEDNVPGLINVTVDAQTGECTQITYAHSQFVNPSISQQAAMLAREDLTAVVDGWKARAGGEFSYEKTALEDFGVFNYTTPEEYGNPGTRDCAPEAALCAALESVARMTGKAPGDFAEATVSLRFNGVREERRHYIADINLDGQRYIVEVESPAVWLMRVLVAQ